MTPEDPRESLPDFVPSWQHLYWFVVGNLVAIILFLYWLTEAFL